MKALVLARGAGTRLRPIAHTPAVLRPMGCAPAHSFAVGLRATVWWYEENRGWWEPLKAPSRGPAAPSAPGAGGAQAAAGCAP
jgi:hypothetical protein